MLLFTRQELFVMLAHLTMHICICICIVPLVQLPLFSETTDILFSLPSLVNFLKLPFTFQLCLYIFYEQIKVFYYRYEDNEQSNFTVLPTLFCEVELNESENVFLCG